jgi:pimeloyl-ACP methyl ester carboxylesterase
MEPATKRHVERTGSGPPVVLVHGFGGSARNFRKQGRALQDAYTLVTYDLAGHGRSARPEDPSAYELERLTGELGEVVDAEGGGAESGRAVVVGGLSLGAHLALTYALAAEPAPRALVLAAFPGNRSEPRRVRWALDFARMIEEQGLDAAGARFVWGEGTRFDEQSAALIRQGFLEHAPHALAAILKQVLAVVPEPDSLGPALARFPSPALLIAGSEDADAIAANEAFARHLPHAEAVVLPGAGHLVNLQASGSFNGALRRFLDRLPRTS